jgi:hypothetical protein
MPKSANPLLRNQLQPGDIIAFYGSDWRSRIIQWATLGPSHVGIVCEWHLPGDRAPQMVLVESTTMCNHYCLHTGRLIDGVQVQWPEQRIEDYEGRAKLYRARPEWALTDSQSKALTRNLRNVVGTGYDTPGAIWSGSRILKHLPFFGYSDGGTLFCSQMIAQCLMRFGLLPIGSPGVYNPGSLLRTLLMNLTYQRGVPL